MIFKMSKTRLAVGIVAVLSLIPATAYATHTFSDVPEGQFYTDAVEWALQTGVTTGKTPTSFDPDGTTLRKEVVTFEKRLYDRLIENEMGMFDYAQASPSDTVTSLTPVDLAAATNTVTIPEGHTGRLEVTFAAESACTGGEGTFFLFKFVGPWCEVRISIDGTDVYGMGAAFDSSDKDSNVDTVGDETIYSWEGHTATYVSDVLPAGAHTVTIQTNGAGSTAPDFRMGDWSLTTQAHYATAWAPA